MFIVDERVDIERIRAFAEAFDNLPEPDKNMLNQSFKGGEGVEFYTGLLAGLSKCYYMLEKPELNQQAIISGFISVVSRKILDSIE